MSDFSVCKHRVTLSLRIKTKARESLGNERDLVSVLSCIEYVESINSITYNLEKFKGWTFLTRQVQSRTEEPAKAYSCAHDRRALQQLALNVHVKH